MTQSGTRMPIKYNLVGKKFGKWKVTKNLGTIPGKGPHTYYRCICECGRKNIIPSTNLIQKHSLSCRFCAHGGMFKFRLAPVFSHIKSNAEARKIKYSINHAYVLKIMEKQKWKCALTGLPLKVEWTKSKKGHSLSSTSTASLDRINSKLGYVPGNVQWVYKPLNNMKWDLSQKEFIQICHLVTKKHPKTV
jgi:hypothetical protein